MVIAVRDGNVVFVPSTTNTTVGQTLKDSKVNKLFPISSKLRQKSVSRKFLESVIQDDSALGGYFERYPNLLTLLDASVPSYSKGQTVRDFLSSGIVIPDDIKNKLVALSQENWYTTKFSPPENFNLKTARALDKINRVLGHDIYERLLDYNLISGNIEQIVKGVFTNADIIRLQEGGVSEMEVRDLLEGVMPEATPSTLDEPLRLLYDDAAQAQLASVDNWGNTMGVPAEVAGNPSAASEVIANLAAEVTAEPKEPMVEGGQDFGNSTVPFDKVQQSELFAPREATEIMDQVNRLVGEPLGKLNDVRMPLPDSVPAGPGPVKFNPLKPDVAIHEPDLEKYASLDSQIIHFGELLEGSLSGETLEGGSPQDLREHGKDLINKLDLAIAKETNLANIEYLKALRNDMVEYLKKAEQHSQVGQLAPTIPQLGQDLKPRPVGKNLKQAVQKYEKEAVQLTSLSQHEVYNPNNIKKMRQLVVDIDFVLGKNISRKAKDSLSKELDFIAQLLGSPNADVQDHGNSTIPLPQDMFD